MSNEPDCGEAAGDPIELMTFCRHVEDHLTQANGGHLVRIVGPGFELVKQWFTDGVPIGIVSRGIAARVERHEKGSSTRPLRIEFCAGDVGALFESWRRAVGLTTRAPAASSDEAALTSPDEAASRRRPSLVKHLDRAIERLTRVAGRMDLSDSVRDSATALLSDLVTLRDRARGARGPARDALVVELEPIDRLIMALAQAAASPDDLRAARRDAEQDMAAYRTRLSEDGWRRAVETTMDQGLRDRLGLPMLAL